MEFLLGLASSLLSKYPIVASIFMGMGVARAIFKPLSLFLHSIADATPSKKDNELLEKAESSKIWKGLVLALDYLASIKLNK